MGKRTVIKGNIKTKFDDFCFNNFFKSLALNITITEIAKKIHSKPILYVLLMPISKPKKSKEKGHNSWLPPVKKSPIKLCWRTATKYGNARFLKTQNNGTKIMQQNMTE